MNITQDSSGTSIMSIVRSIITVRKAIRVAKESAHPSEKPFTRKTQSDVMMEGGVN